MSAPPPDNELDLFNAEENGEDGAASNAAFDVRTHEGPLRHLMDDNFLQYASYVIRDRAIPDLDDGLKPVQRRIMHSLFETDDGKFTKVANIVGHCMQYHPHGDASIAEALVALTNKGYLIEGQGNFGNLLTGDPPAASRYIECRLTELAREELFNPELTRTAPNYDGRRQEPVVLPAKLPLLLMQGAEGIAVGLSTRMLPHNFIELLDAQIAILKKKPFELIPDFPQGGLMDASEYDQGRGRVRVRAVIEPLDDRTLVIREIPYGATTESLMNSVEQAARKKKVEIRSIDDFTSEHIEIQIKLSAGADIDKTLAALYAFTQCEMSLSSRPVVIHRNRPVEMDVHQILKYNTRKLQQILERELHLKKKKLEDEQHNKTLVQIFVEHRIYKWIEECTTYDAVQQAVLNGVNQFRDLLARDVTMKDVEMLLGVRIKRISQFDIDKNRRDIEGIVRDLEQVEKDLSDLTQFTVRYLRALKRKYGEGRERRTRCVSFKPVEIRKLTERELAIRHDTEKHYIGHDIDGDEWFSCSSRDRIVLVWNNGRYRVIPPPDKLFVDENLIYCAVADRDREMTLVYTDKDGMTYLKRFTFGGAILSRDYWCTGDEEAEILLLEEGCPQTLYVQYKKQKRMRILQQEFRPKDSTVLSAKAKGRQMTVKPIRAVSSSKPRNWGSKTKSPRGALV